MKIGDLAMHRKYHHKLSIIEHKERILKSGDKHMIDWYNRGDGIDAQLAKEHPICIFCDEEYKKRLKIMEEDKQLKQMEEQRQQEFKLKADNPKVLVAKLKTCTAEEQEQIWKLKTEQEKYLKIIEDAQSHIAVIDEKLSALNIADSVIVKSLKYCNFCNVSLSKPVYRLRHLETHAHKVKAGIIHVETYPKTCEPCGYEAKTKNTWDIHCKGKKHKLNVTSIETVEVVKVD